MTIHPQPVPEMVGRQLSDREPDPAFQQSELERSLRYCKDVLGLGLKA